MTFSIGPWTLPAAVLAVTGSLLATGGAAFGAPKSYDRPHPHPVPAVKNVHSLKNHFVKAPAQPAPFVAKHTTWPQATSETLALTDQSATDTTTPRASEPGKPVWARPVKHSAGQTGPHHLQVSVLGHTAAQAAGIPGVLLTVSGDQAGAAQLGLDYAGFAQSYGGNYGSRLQLVSYPACVLTTPAVASCRVATPLRSTNNAKAATVSATVTIPATSALLSTGSAAKGPLVVAATTTGTPDTNGSKGGTYAATSLSASGSWSGGGNSGNFTYSYPITLPTAPSSLTPSVELAYDSGATDGENATTTPQSSWIGEGWSSGDSFIEQSFQSCSASPEGSAAPTKTYDECYDGPIYTMLLHGSSVPLVWDSSKSAFKTRSADGSIVKHLCTLPSGAKSFTDPTCVAGNSNGTDTEFKDWWQITDRKGTTYSFGMNHLPGWGSNTTATSSVATISVYSAHSGDPCFKSSGFSASVCTVPYRWGLDFVADVHGNAMSYYYNQDVNYYGAFNGASMKPYVRDQRLDHIDYGFTSSNAYGTVPDKVLFHTSPRCVASTCPALSDATKANWPDVPYDQVCASGKTCTAHGPSYFSTVRLTNITTEQDVAGSATTYVPIDSYDLTQSIPQAGDGTVPTLWLNQIVRTGSATNAGPSSGKPIQMPPVTFTPTAQMDSRLDTTTDGLPAFKKYRLATITTETGSQITATYQLADPCSASAKPTASANTKSCYPVSWTPAGYDGPITDWFNKYAVTSVTQTDPTGGASQQTTSYKYVGGAAWHYDDNELVKAKYRTYGQFRGYGDVITYVGDKVTDSQSKTETTYYRGMSKDNDSTVVNVKDSILGLHEDVDQLAGRPLESSAYLGDNPDHSTITSYWVSAPAASRSRTGLPALTANLVEPVEAFTRQAVTSTGATTWRYTEVDTSYDTDVTHTNFGLADHVYSHTSPANPAYDSCTSNTYAAANTDKNIVGVIAQAEVDSVACGGYTAANPASVPGSVNTLTAPASVSRPDQVISASRTFYDDTHFATTFPQPSAPSLGDVTMTQKADGYTGGAFTWHTTKRSKYDSVGRLTDSYDGDGNHSGTAYTVNSAGLITKTTDTNALNQSASSGLDTQRGLVTSSTDANAVTTTEQYDTLGRLTGVWKNNRATSSPANLKYSYAVSNTGPTAVTTQATDELLGYHTSTTIYDGLLRIRQTQAETPRGGRLINDTFYDTRGWVSARYLNWNDTANDPGTAVASAPDLQKSVTTEHVYTYNSLGKVVIDRNQDQGVDVSRTTTVYNGDRTTVIPPDGGTVTTTIVDPLGRTTEVDNYVQPPTLNAPADPYTGTFTVSGGTSRAVTYGYDAHGNQASTTQGHSGPAWTETYNVLGQVIAKSDPDAGSTTDMHYDGAGNLTQSTDARGKTLSYSYDALNRKTGLFASAVAAQQPADPTTGATGNQLAGWVYDNSNAVAGVTHAIGHVTTEYTFIDKNIFSSQQQDFNVFGESSGTVLTVPGSENALAGTYRVRHVYTPNSGLPQYDVYDAGGGLPDETVKHTYRSQFDLPNSVTGLAGYNQTTTYDALSRVIDLTIGPTASTYTDIVNVYDENNGRLTSRAVSHTTPDGVAPQDQQDYRYDLAGNITRQTSTRNASTATAETQCYSYDGLDQLTAAWTANDQCAATPTGTDSSTVADKLGASSAYWTSWNIDELGDRKSQTQHAFTGGPSTDTTTTYGYGTATGAQPHTLTSTSTTGATTGTTSYSYDPGGNMTGRNAGQGSQTLAHDALGKLTGVTGSTTGDTSYEYDAEGNLLIQKAAGSATLYVGNQQYTLNSTTGAVSGTRYYTLPDGSQAIRTSSATTAFTYAIADAHGTPCLYLDNNASAPSWRQYTPYGAPRGSTVTVPDNHGFLNKPMDIPTGLTIVGARPYDPDTGRFIADDPILEQTDPTQLNGYAYAGNNPAVRDDPTGMDSCATGGQGCEWNKHCGCYMPPGASDNATPPTPEEPYTHSPVPSGGSSGHSGGGSGSGSSGGSSCGSGSSRTPAPIPMPSSGGGGGCFHNGGASVKPTPTPTPWHDGLAVTGTPYGQPGWIHSGGLCINGDAAGGVNAAAVSICLMFDRHGVGLTETVDTETGVGMGADWGVSGVVSNASVKDQAGGFDTTTINGAYAYGGQVTVGTSGKVTTISVGPSFGLEADGGVGGSNTYVQYVHLWN